MVQRAFLESNGYNLLTFIYGDEMVVFDCHTIQEAQTMDCSAVEGCVTAKEAAMWCDTEVYPYIKDEWERVTIIDEV